MEATIALAGNPNSGKTTLFNALTGARQHVGNYPGVTVEKKVGKYKSNGTTVNIVDLPGTYSLTAYSLEEVVARDFVVNEKPATVIAIVDASNLERNLYLTLQFMEMGLPVCIALNMIDVAESRGIAINHEQLSQLLGVPVVPTIARNGKGKQELMATAIEMAQSEIDGPALNISYGGDIDGAIEQMLPLILEAEFLTDTYQARWVALKYLENDQQILQLGYKQDPQVADKLLKIASQVADHIRRTFDTDPELVIADQRYGYIHSIIQQGVVSRKDDRNRLHMSDQIDRVLTNRLIGPFVMVGIIFGLYHFVFTYSELPVGWFEAFFGWLGGLADAHLPGGLFKSLVISGVIDGVGGVLGFVPLIMFMFFGIAILEDSGYLARVAFMLDRVFRIFGLHGSSVMPFIVSGGIAGGCAVPGVMATRTLKSRRERLATLLTVPFMNCGAKLPVFALLVGTFFARMEAQMMFIITLISWMGALLAAKLMRVTVIKGTSTPFVMELPPYRLPTLKGLLIHTWERTWQYIKKAGTVILGISILLWAMMTFPMLPETRQVQFEQQRQNLLNQTPAAVVTEDESTESSKELSPEALALKDQLNDIAHREAEAGLRHSIAGRLGTALESVSQWAGFDWRTNIALLGGFAAKEVVVSTLGTAYSMGQVNPEVSATLAKTLAASPNWRPLVAFCLILFIIFYAPCFVAVVCISKEAGSWKWGAFSILFNTSLAFLLAVAVYQAGSALGF